MEARPGLGRLDDKLSPQTSFDVFGYGYGTGDELRSMTRETTATNELFDLDVEGRIAVPIRRAAEWPAAGGNSGRPFLAFDAGRLAPTSLVYDVPITRAGCSKMPPPITALPTSA